MQIEPALSIDKPANPKRGDNATHAQQGRANPVATNTAHAIFRGHHLGPVIQVQAEQVDWCADQLDGSWDG